MRLLPILFLAACAAGSAREADLSEELAAVGRGRRRIASPPRPATT